MSHDDDAVRIPINRAIQGHDVYLIQEYRCSPQFAVLIEEGNEVTRNSYDELETFLNDFYERKKKEEKKKKFEPTPLVVYTDDEDVLTGQKKKYGGRRTGNFDFVDAKVTGIHASSGHPILKIGNNRAQQHTGYSYNHLLVPLSDEAKNNLLAKQKAKQDADDAYEKALCEFEIRSLKDWVSSGGKEGLKKDD